MFHFAPQHATHFHPYGYPTQPTYNPFQADVEEDLPFFSPFSGSQLGAHPRHRHHQHQLEQELYRREQELSIRKEVQRRRLAAQRAAEREELIAQFEERERRERQQAMMREQQRRAFIEQEIRRRMIVDEQEEEAQRQANIRRQQLAEQDSEPEQEDHSLDTILQSFLPLFFGQGVHQQQEESPVTQPSPSDQQPESIPAEQTIAEPTPAPAETAPAPPAETSTITTDEPASSSPVDELHQHYRTHLHRRQALSTLSSLGDSCSAQRSAFTLPSTLTFQPSPPPSTSSNTTAAPTPTPKLAFQSSNAPFLAYEDFLVSLLSKIDAVSTGGDRSIKQARKDLVKQVQGELNRLDEVREKAWEAEQTQSGAQEAEAVRADDPETPSLSTAEPLSSTPLADPPVPSLPIESITRSDPSSTTDESSTPLTPATLASLLASSAPFAEASHPPSAEEDRSDDDSDSTLSVDSIDVASILDEVMRQAGKLGVEVCRREGSLKGAGDELGAVAELILC